jgi:hypothetical protein
MKGQASSYERSGYGGKFHNFLQAPKYCQPGFSESQIVTFATMLPSRVERGGGGFSLCAFHTA